MKTIFPTLAALLALAPAGAGADEAPAPPNPVTVQLASGTETLYPLTTHQFPVGPPAGSTDPVNLIFEGAADPRQIRAALLSLNGDRTAFGLPNAIPFNCTWTDAEGEEQATWTAGAGWEGAPVQLACGPYAIRFHLRLFGHGGRTLGGAHMDIQTPGTTDHNTVSWNFPQTIVKLDLIRSGLLAAEPYMTDVFGPTPTHRTMPGFILNGMPLSLRALLELPLGPVGTFDNVPVPCNGRAVVLNVLPSFVPSQSDTTKELVIQFNQGIPKPFCTNGEWVFVQGPVKFVTRVQLNPSGKYLRTVLISGLLNVTPFDPATGQPTGPTVQAVVSETHRGMLTDNYAEVTWSRSQTIYGTATQTFADAFTAGQDDSFWAAIDCGTPAP